MVARKAQGGEDDTPMHLHVFFHNISPSAVVYDYVATKMAGLAALAPEILSRYIVISRSERPAVPGRYCANALVVLSGTDLHAIGVGDDPRAAVDRVSATLVAQLRRRRRVRCQRRHPAAEGGQ